MPSPAFRSHPAPVQAGIFFRLEHLGELPARLERYPLVGGVASKNGLLPVISHTIGNLSRKAYRSLRRGLGLQVFIPIVRA
jgi:hypothetical protein